MKIPALAASEVLVAVAPNLGEIEELIERELAPVAEALQGNLDYLDEFPHNCVQCAKVRQSLRLILKLIR